jgi:hypothetical protein
MPSMSVEIASQLFWVWLTMNFDLSVSTSRVAGIIAVYHYAQPSINYLEKFNNWLKLV